MRDTEYAFLTTRVRAMERGLLTRERMERMLNAPTPEAAARVLTECGYPELATLTGPALEQALERRQRETMEDLAGLMPDQAVLELFQARFDYHNAKVLVKGEGLGQEQDRLLTPGGRYDPARLAADYRQENLKDYGERFRQGVARAREVLGATGDPQQADLALDRAYFAQLTELAQGTGSAFLQGYVALLIDAANLRAAVRAARLGKGREFLRQVIIPGGKVSPTALAAAKGERLAQAFRGGPLAAAAAAGAAVAAPGAGPLTEFERLCDDAVTAYFDGARMVTFGVEPVAGYLYARQSEATAIRTILAGRMAGLDEGVIRQRLRRSYC
ncbi:MAG TPA: V-type ATPase subunit [Candidatus Enterenecus merdae]|nr:V-type ATPase subunit [Candidatus Enterenecus merdae]